MINWERVNELRDEIGAEDFGEIVELFLSEVEERLETLCADKSVEAVGEDMHFLKGSALNLGFENLASICQDREDRAATGEIITDLPSVIASYSASKSEFLAKLAKDQAA